MEQLVRLVRLGKGLLQMRDHNLCAERLVDKDGTIPMGKMFFNIPATFGEFETDLIRTR
ncbi:hypothetical protein ACFSC1_18595 [Paracoccus aurantiacus]|nr:MULTISPECIES: hypothetical protein [Paracoccus]